MKLGDEIMVKVIEIDRLGRINLSRKAVFGDISKVPGASISDSATPETGRPPMPPRPANRPFQGDRGRRT